MNIELFSAEELTTLEAIEVRGGQMNNEKETHYGCGAQYECSTQSGNCVAGCSC